MVINLQQLQGITPTKAYPEQQLSNIYMENHLLRFFNRYRQKKNTCFQEAFARTDSSSFFQQHPKLSPLLPLSPIPPSSAIQPKEASKQKPTIAKPKPRIQIIEQSDMSEHEQSLGNESITNAAESEELKKKITLSSSELIELTYNQQKFNAKLEELNRQACTCIDDQRYSEATVYLNQAEKVLEYSAGCGKTIERWLITTILNNQACLLQRTSYFEQSSNYLQAILFNINDFLEGIPQLPTAGQQLTDTVTFIERKMALALYHLRFCALTSHSKNHQLALKSARTALNLLKQLSAEEYAFEFSMEKQKSGGQQWPKLSEQNEHKNLLKELSRIKPIQSFIDEQFQLHLSRALEYVKQYLKKCDSHNHPQLQDIFESYSIGNLMQAEVMELKLKPNQKEFLEKEFSITGKMFRVVHISMAFFTIATELRLIAASKYALNDDQRKSSNQYKESKVNHLISIILVARFLPVKSVFFDHTLTSFKNHYGLNLKDMAMTISSQINLKPISIIKCSTPPSDEKSESSSINKTMQIHESKETHDIGSEDIIKNTEVPTLKHPDPMTEIHNQNVQAKKLKQVKSKSKIFKLATSQSTKTIDTDKNYLHLSKNNENKSKNKNLSKTKEAIRSRAKNPKPDQDQQRRAIYYGFTSKSRSKSKKDIVIERKNSKKGLLTMKSGLAEPKKIKQQAKIDEQYGVKSMGGFHPKTIASKVRKSKILRNSQAEQQCQYQIKFNKMGNVEQINMRKIKSPRIKKEASRRKTLSKDKYNL